MYHSLFNSKLQYAILCWGSASATSISKLQVLQNKAIKNMNKAPRYYRLDNYFLNQRILKVHDLYNLEVAKFMHGHFHDLLPVCFAPFFVETRYLHNYSTRHSGSRNYNITTAKTSRGQKSIKFLGPKLWNEVPNDLRTLSKVNFKIKMKNLLLARY